jgi:hypothetical protein
MLTTSPSSPGITFRLRSQFPTFIRAVLCLVNFRPSLNENPLQENGCFGIGPHHGAAQDPRNRSQLLTSDAGSLPCLM